MAKHDYNKDDIRQMAKDENVKFLRLMFTDLFGTIKNVEVPISQLEKLLIISYRLMVLQLMALLELKKVICIFILIYQLG